MQNTLKAETIPIIKNLQDAKLRTVMITGTIFKSLIKLPI